MGSNKSGGRIVDSFTLMPKWIRNLIRIEGEKIKTLDYSCLHPNLANTVYDGCGKRISHQQVADFLQIDRSTAKIEHLSFFNKRWEGMRKSPLFEYYLVHEPEMMRAIKKEKEEFGHKITSKQLFQAEVELMRKVIIELNNMDILTGYVYDALFCHSKNETHVRQVMN